MQQYLPLTTSVHLQVSKGYRIHLRYRIFVINMIERTPNVVAFETKYLPFNNELLKSIPFFSSNKHRKEFCGFNFSCIVN